MREGVVTRYEAKDGKSFDTRAECLAYESKEILKAVSDICKKRESCNNCLFYSYGCILCGTPESWDFDEDEDF